MGWVYIDCELLFYFFGIFGKFGTIGLEFSKQKWLSKILSVEHLAVFKDLIRHLESWGRV